MGELTDLRIEELTPKGDTARTRLWLKAGKVSAEFNTNKTGESDTAVTLGQSVAGPRGTTFSLFVDPVGRFDVVSVTEGTVSVDPRAPSLATTDVQAGREVLVTSSRVYSGAAGKVGLVGGVGPVRAYGLVLAQVERTKAACGLVPASSRPFSLGTIRGVGWQVTLRFARPSGGSATWLVSGSRVKPTNALATKIGRGCR